MQDPIEEDKSIPVGGEGNFLADMTDDDATVLDSLVSSEAEPPDADELPIVRLDMRPLAVEAVPDDVVMRTRTVRAPIPGVAHLLMNANPWRKRAVVRINKTTTILLGESRTAVSSLSTSARFGTNSASEIILNTTGEVWGLIDGEVTDITIGVMEEVVRKAGR